MNIADKVMEIGANISTEGYTGSMYAKEFVRRFLLFIEETGPTIPIQEAWEAAGGNPGIKATKEELLTALRQLDAVCDEADLTAAAPKVSGMAP